MKMATLGGTTYNITEIGGTTNAYNAVVTRVKGDYIPIYFLLDAWMFEEWEEGKDYYHDGTSTVPYTRAGKVLAIRDVESDLKIQAIIAVLTYNGDDFYNRKSLSTYGSGDAGSLEIFCTSIDRSILSDHNWDPKNFCKYDDRVNNTYAWDGNHIPDAQRAINRMSIQPIKDWPDGAGTEMVPSLGTLVFPMVKNDDPDHIRSYIGISIIRYESGIGTRIPYQKSFSWMSVGEDESVMWTATDRYDVGPRQSNMFEVYGKIWEYTSGYDIPDSDNPPFEDDINPGGGGYGPYQDDSDYIPEDGTPTVSALSTGFINMYDLSPADLKSLHDFLMTEAFLANYKKLMNDPMDYIISLQLVPYAPNTGAYSAITVGGVETPVSANVVSSQYVDLDCGQVYTREVWQKYYDYDPYTSVHVYLPFIGIRQLDINEVMAGYTRISYRIDVLNGDCVATISCTNNKGLAGAVYHFEGNCNMQVPVTGKDFSQKTQRSIGIINSAASGAMLGAGAGIAMGAFGSIPGAIGGAAGGIIKHMIDEVTNPPKTIVQRAGNLSGNSGVMGNYTPYLIFQKPCQSLAGNFNHYKGFVSNVTATLGNVSGYTEMAFIDLSGIQATAEEVDMIDKYLKTGVYL